MSELRESWEVVKPHIDELLEAYLHDRLPIMIEGMLERILAKQRKDVADELVRILLEKALKA